MHDYTRPRHSGNHCPSLMTYPKINIYGVQNVVLNGGSYRFSMLFFVTKKLYV